MLAAEPGTDRPPLQLTETWTVERRNLCERCLDRLGDYLTDAATAGSAPDDLPDSPSHQLDQPEEKQ